MIRDQKLKNVISITKTFPSLGVNLFTFRELITKQGTISCFLERTENRTEYLLFDPIIMLKIDFGKLTCTDSEGTREFKGNPLRELQKYLAGFSNEQKSLCFASGFVGYLGYDCVGYLENIKLPAKCAPEPDAFLFLYGTAVILNHVDKMVTIVVNELSHKNERFTLKKLKERMGSVSKSLRQFQGQPKSNLKKTNEKSISIDFPKVVPEKFIESVRIIRKHIRDGNIFQCVLSEKFEIDGPVSSPQLYKTLRKMNPSPYHYCFSLPDFDLVGASPEPFLRVKGQSASVYPIAGTRPRGQMIEEDKSLETQLRKSRKEKAEHVMLVDLARNDLGRVCSPGSIQIEDFMRTKRFSHVMHLVSTVTGKLKLKSMRSSWEALLACFPAGTLTGAPKIRAMEIISELEPIRRGLYGGVFVLSDFGGNLDSCITIRSAIVRDNKAVIQAGAGIVADSQVPREYREIFSKSLAIRRAAATIHALTGEGNT